MANKSYLSLKHVAQTSQHCSNFHSWRGTYYSAKAAHCKATTTVRKTQLQAVIKSECERFPIPLAPELERKPCSKSKTCMLTSEEQVWQSRPLMKAVLQQQAFDLSQADTLSNNLKLSRNGQVNDGRPSPISLYLHSIEYKCAKGPEVCKVIDTQRACATT